MAYKSDPGVVPVHVLSTILKENVDAVSMPPKQRPRQRTVRSCTADGALMRVR
jgi:hypothetical protein